jgi:putative transposase
VECATEWRFQSRTTFRTSKRASQAQPNCTDLLFPDSLHYNDAVEQSGISMSNWPHSPPHWLLGRGVYMITAATLNKVHYFANDYCRSFLHNALLSTANEKKWALQAWAVLSNHYHFIAQIDDVSSLPIAISKLHSSTAAEINKYDGQIGRQVWYQYWDSRITFEKSWLARIKYVTENPVKHGLVGKAVEYPYCSAGWIASKASKQFVRTLDSFKIDRIHVLDDY